MDFGTINTIFDSIVSWIGGAADFIGGFFGSLQALEQAPVETANGVAGLAGTLKAVKDQILAVVGLVKGE